MLPKRTLGWWYWLATIGLLAAHFAGSPIALACAMMLTAFQGVHFRLLEGETRAFSVQVRVAFLGLLLLGMWEPFRFLHGVQLVGTTARVLCGYCLLARVLTLMPWNREVPLSRTVAICVLFTRYPERCGNAC